MSNIVQSVQHMGEMMGNGMKNLMDIAEGYIYEDDPDSTDPATSSQPEGTGSDINRNSDSGSPEPIDSISNHSATASSASASSFSGHGAAPSSELIQTTDITSGWIHIPAAYLDDGGGNGGRVVKSFGLRNLVDHEVVVEVGSDMRDQVSFWIGEDETPLDSNKSSASSTSSSPSSALSTTLAPLSTCTIYLAFQPSGQTMSASLQPLLKDYEATPRVQPSDATPRVHPSLSRNGSDNIISPPSSIPSLSRKSTSDNSNQSAPGSGKSIAQNISSRKSEAIHRAFSVHGSIAIRAASNTEVPADDDYISASGQSAMISRQSLNIPLFATVCRSLFTAALIDPVSGRTSGSQLSSGRLELDFGADSVIGGEYHRDVLLVNRSEVELVWSTAVVNARNKDAVWFSLRDLDSENVFGVDTSAQPVPLPPLSSRHLRLELRVRKPMTDFDFDFLISNVNQPGNVVTCHAVGSGSAEASDNTLKIISETSIDFGQICDGMWSKKVVTCKNTGDKPLDVKFSATPGYDVVFRLAGVAGDDMDEELPFNSRSGRFTSGTIQTMEKRGQSSDPKRGRELSVSRKSSRGVSPSSSAGIDSSSVGDDSSPSLPAQLTADLSHRLTSLNNRTSRSVPSASDRASSGRDQSQPPSRALSRVTSRSSYLHHTSGAESDEEEDLDAGVASATVADSLGASPKEHSSLNESTADKAMPNQIEEVTMRPGTEYRILLLYRPARLVDQPAEIAGQLRETSWKVYLDSSSSRPASASRRTLKCTAMSCTSLITISTGSTLNFGEVTVGASKTGSIVIQNLSALSARVEIAAISKVLSASRNVIVIPPFEEVEERIEFFPRRINEKYEKQIFVRNLLNRSNDQLLEIRSKNVDVYNLTIHSHLYRILTPSGSNFLDFGSVIINAPTIRTVQFENLTFSPLLLELVASQPEDVELFVKAEDAPVGVKAGPGKYAETTAGPERAISPPNGELKERFMETMRELSVKTDGPATKAKAVKAKGSKLKDKTEQTGADEVPKLSVGASMMAALKKGGRGKPVQLYGNAVVYKDRNLLEDHEYLDLAAGPPVAAHRSSPRSKRTALLDTIELEDKSKLSGQHPRIPKLDFAASAKAIGLFSKDARVKKAKPTQAAVIKPLATLAFEPASTASTITDITPPFHTTNQPTEQSSNVSPSPILGATRHEPPPSLASVMNAMNTLSTVDNGGTRSPALTAKRVEQKEIAGADVSKMTVDELLVAIEQQDSQKSSITHSTLDEEEAYVRRAMALRKELQNLILAEKLVPARSLSVAAQASCKLIVIMTPNASTRPHISTRAKRADSRIFIKLAEFDRKLLNSAAANSELGELPVRDLVIRSSCVRSVLEVGQSSINFGGCEKGEVKSKTIVVQNKSDCIGMFRLRTSGSISSGDLKLGMGRYGVIAAFGRKEVEQFSFTPSLTGNYNETLTVENVLDGYNDQKVSVKAVVRKQPAMTVDMTSLDFGAVNLVKSKSPVESGFCITNVSKHERVFVVEVAPSSGVFAFAEISLAADEKGGGIALSKGEEEEVEAILQKLKIARRKQKPDKIQKYEIRLAELGVQQPSSDADTVEAEDEGDEASTAKTLSEEKKIQLGGEERVTSLSVTLGPNQKIKVLVKLVPNTNTARGAEDSGPVDAMITVHDRKNTDETISIAVKATGMDDEMETAFISSSHAQPCQEPLHRQIMLHCLKLTLQCPVSQTAFCVGSTLFLPDTSPHYNALRQHFTPFPIGDPDPSGLILADGWSRQIPGNTHAEANALTNFRSKYAELSKTESTSAFSSSASTASASSSVSSSNASAETPLADGGAISSSLTSESSLASTISRTTDTSTTSALPLIEDVLADSDCYATMEPCSVRTSGGPSCALELVRAQVRKVYLGVEEPPDFVQCEGVKILEEGGVEVGHVAGLEENCLRAARRGRS